MKNKLRTASFGSVSSGTMRPEDLIPAFASALDDLRLSREHRKLVTEAGKVEVFDGTIEAQETAQDILEDLFDALDCYAPPYAYFGAHTGDGSDYGFWLSESFESDFDGLKVESTSDVPKGYSGEVAQVSDHGNVTLYAYSRGRSREVWSLV